MLVAAKKVREDSAVDKSLDQQGLTGLLLFMLLSREKPNIDEESLRWLEASSDMMSDGLISDQKVKKMFDAILKHFSICIKKKVARQKDIEQVFVIALINFKAHESTVHLVKQYVTDNVNRVLGIAEPYSSNNSISGFGAAGAQQNSLNPGSSDFI